jgi:hypothetical protein
VKERSRSSYLKLFPATRPLAYVAIDIMGPLPRTEHGNRFLLVMTDRFSKLTKTVPLRTTMDFVCARAFCENWVYSYGDPLYVLTDNGSQFAAKFFQACCRELGVTKVFTTAYHPQTNGQVERFNRTILDSLRGYIGANQSNWDEFTSALTFAYNARVHASLGMAPFDLVLSRQPVTLTVSIPSGEDPPSGETEKMRFLQRLRELRPFAAQQLRLAQERYKKSYDAHVRPKDKDIPEGGWVYVRRETHELGVNPKLIDQSDGLYQVVANDEHTLLLRVGMDLIRVSSDRITSALSPLPESEAERYLGNRPDVLPSEDEVSRQPVDPEIEAPHDPGDEGYVVERLIGLRSEADGSDSYKVQWFGYSREEDTWEPPSNLPPSMVQKYRRRVGLPANI